jgi:hypothetical protein
LVGAEDYALWRQNFGSSIKVGELHSPPLLAGDYNTNGIVDAADYAMYRNTLGMSVIPFTGADGNGNGTVGPEDYDVWRQNFGAIQHDAAFVSVTATNSHDGDEHLGSTLLSTAIAEEMISTDDGTDEDAHIYVAIQSNVGLSSNRHRNAWRGRSTHVDGQAAIVDSRLSVVPAVAARSSRLERTRARIDAIDRALAQLAQTEKRHHGRVKRNSDMTGEEAAQPERRHRPSDASARFDKVLLDEMNSNWESLIEELATDSGEKGVASASDGRWDKVAIEWPSLRNL